MKIKCFKHHHFIHYLFFLVGQIFTIPDPFMILIILISKSYSNRKNQGKTELRLCCLGQQIRIKMSLPCPKRINLLLDKGSQASLS